MSSAPPRAGARALLPAPTLPLVRALLLGVNLVGSLTFLAELVFIGHFREPLQVVAVAAAVFGAIGTLVGIGRSAPARAVAGLIALGMMGAGGVGLVVHLSRNYAYADTKTLWAVLTGPLPVLAPLSLANVGLLLLVAVWLGWQNGASRA